MERDPLDGLQINLSDPASMRAARDQAHAAIREREVQVENLMSGIERLRGLVVFLTGWIGDEAPSSGNGIEPVVAPDRVRPSERNDGTTALASEVVNRENRKIRAKDVHRILIAEGHRLESNAVSNALYYAAHRAGTIQTAPGRGFYAPLDYSEELILDSTRGDAIE